MLYIRKHSFAEVLDRTRAYLRENGYDQIPQLSSVNPIDVSAGFDLTTDANKEGGGTRRAVMVGINYVGDKPGELSGCWNDVGHGTRIRDNDRGEEGDGYDEALCPRDFKSAGLIRDDDLFDILVKPLSDGVHMVSLMDCCHSGSIMDLPYVFKSDGGQTEMYLNPRMNVGMLGWGAHRNFQPVEGGPPTSCQPDRNTQSFSVTQKKRIHSFSVTQKKSTDLILLVRRECVPLWVQCLVEFVHGVFVALGLVFKISADRNPRNLLALFDPRLTEEERFRASSLGTSLHRSLYGHIPPRYDRMFARPSVTFALPPGPRGSATAADVVATIFSRRAGGTPAAPAPAPTSSGPSVFFAWFANYFIHMFLGTDPKDKTRQKLGRFSSTSIYGRTEADVADLRTRIDGKVHLENGFAPTLKYLDRVNGREPQPGRNAFQNLMNQHVGLPVVHTLVLREHNRVCDVLRVEYPHFSDDLLFETARNSVINTLFHIVRTEYISTITGGRLTSSVQMGPNILTRRLVQLGLNAISAEYLLVYVFHSLIEESTRPAEAATVIRTEEWLGDALGAVDEAYPNRQDAFESLIRYGLTSSSSPHGLQTVHGSPIFMRHVELFLMSMQEANGVVGYNEARRQLGLKPYANIGELLEGTSLERAQMDSLFGGDIESVDFYTGITIDNSKLSKPKLLCEVSSTIISSLAFGVLPVIHGAIQPLLPPCILSEVRACRKRGFLSTLLSHHLPSLQGIPTQWTMDTLTSEFYLPPQNRVPVAAVYVMGDNRLISAELCKSDDDDDCDRGADKYSVPSDAAVYLLWKEKGLVKMESTNFSIVTEKNDADDDSPVYSAACAESSDIEDKRNAYSVRRCLV
ncbi:hypothetical protein ACHAW5_008662 [Stephanodiscus triporus]|uniref:Peroxinectin n=1 Tax=Stephanodiscus triporus TaxID=2934178 RepID=A0ABD3PMD6_9STRA